MYPFNYQPPQITALANRLNPQTVDNYAAPVMSQAPPANSGQIQPSGLQPQPMVNNMMRMRPQITALAQQYNPQFVPQMMGGNPNAAPMQPQLQQAQYDLAQKMQNNPASAMFGYKNWWNPQPAYNPSFTPAGQAQNNFLTTPTSPVPQVAVPQGGFAPTMLTGSLPTQMSAGGPQPARQFVPGALGASQRTGGLSQGINGLARYYMR